MAVGINSQPLLPAKPKRTTVPKGYGKVAKAVKNGPKKKYGKAKYKNSQRMI